MSLDSILIKISAEISSLKSAVAKTPQLRKGRVTGMNGEMLDVEIAVDGKPTYGQYTNVARLASYTSPQVDDDVWIVSMGRGRMLCLGKQES